MNKKVIMKAKNLCKTYYSGSEHFHAIRNIDLDVYEGDFTVIMGNSGSGKSTLLYLLSGLDHLTAGEVYFYDQQINIYNEHQLARFRTEKIGYVYQSINLVPDLTLLENVSLPAYIANTKRSDVQTKATHLLKSMGIAEQLHRLPSQTSGGQQQRAAIARALINSPDIIFADEPTGSLNYEQGLAVLDLLTNINNDGKSIIMVTHDIKAACRADRLILIKDGKIDGVLEFDKYDPHDSLNRESIIFSFVTAKE